MSFCREKRVNLKVLSSLRLSFSTISVASTVGELASLEEPIYKKRKTLEDN
jgi:hypothetical protein